MSNFLMGLGIKIIGMVIGKVGADQDAKARWISFVESMADRNKSAAKLVGSYQEQLERLRKPEEPTS